MYEQHFGFQRMPFSANPVEWKFYYSESSTAILSKVLHTLESATGVAVVTGPVGVGKTVLLNHLQGTLARQGQAINIPGTSLRLTEDLYLCIRRRLRTHGVQPVTDETSRWDVVDRLQSSSEFWGPIGLLVDDAHLLTPDLFTELHFLLEQHSGTQPLCRILLAGSHALEETLARPVMSGFAQRIRTHSFLQPLRLVESVEYLKSCLSHVGGSLTNCFDSEAIETVVQAADGSPRCLNLLADESLLLAFRDGANRVTLETVRMALSGVQHLPHAWNISVTDQSGSVLDETLPNNTSRQSSSEGVIEIGADPASDCVEINGHTSESAPEIIDFSETNGPADELPVAEMAATETIDDPPAPDYMAPDSWLDELAETVSLAPLEDDPDDNPELDSVERTFDAGYLLTELESVGDPTMEIDENLEQRLIQAADAAVDDSLTVNDPWRMVRSMLPKFQLWQPAGCWNHGDLVTRHRTQQEVPGRKPSKITAVTNDSHAEAAQMKVYAVNIPACDEPAPVWPPQSSGFGAVTPLAVSILTTSSVGESVTDSEAAGSAASGSCAEIPKGQQAETVDSHSEWSDGQRLNDLTCSDNTVGGEDPQFIPPEDVSDVVPLRLAGPTDEPAHAFVAEDDSADETTVRSEHLFSLPITCVDVSGKCVPQVNSVHELSEELDSSQNPDSGRPVPADGVIRNEMSDEPSGLTSQSLCEPKVEVVDQNTDEETVQLIQPEVIRHARQMLLSAAPAREFRQAAGAENSIFVEESGPRLSVVPAEEQSESLVDGSKIVDTRPGKFHNLFTRMRQR